MSRSLFRLMGSPRFAVILSVHLMGATVTCAYGQVPTSYLMSRLAQLPEFGRAGESARLYGTVDLGYIHSKAEGAPGRWKQQSGGANTSKLGFYASEVLGPGLRAEIKLEAGFEADTGAQQASAVFNRESWVGLRSNELGTVRLGNQINAMLPLFIDPFVLVSTNSVYSWVAGGVMQTSRGVGFNSDLGPGAGTIPVRVQRAITYSSIPKNGFTLQGIVASSPAGPGGSKIGTRGGVVSFSRGSIYLAGSLIQTWTSPLAGGLDGTTESVRTDIPSVGAIYDNGRLVLSTSFAQISPRSGQRSKAEIATIGFIVPLGRLTYRGSAVHRDTIRARNTAGSLVSSSALGLMFGLDYDLSRRTSLYTRAGSVMNHGASSVILNSVALPLEPGTTDPRTGIDTRTVSLGILHHF